ncbi:glycosyltransferase family 4 protein [Butyricimonas synergistica]|uniref:glycosyltransferase family 4 protein n=1 Tax=Butyricimonas synergistica TaxID=544644 RepID=UPI000366C446|nr:glycosyltransferase family 4 protein [Butyricimonas synergistica]
MNILFCSSIYANKDTGLYWSIPNQVRAQGKYDNVFWYNLWMGETEEWEATNYYYSLQDYPSGRLKDLPAPFDYPDLVVFETVYIFAFKAIVFDVWKKNIPYIIIPRSSLTAPAQKIKPVKKWIGNLLFFGKFARKALAIQYLTENEYKESGDKWNKNHVIIGNGITLPSNRKEVFSQKGLKGVFIGRLTLYHKGLDLLVEACNEVQDKLRKAGCSIHIYGQDREGVIEYLDNYVRKKHLDDIVFYHYGAVFGTEKEKVLLDNDFFILTSRLEGHPMALIEALSYGLPCLVTQGSNMREEIENVDAGWGAEVNIDSIAKGLLKILSEKALLDFKSKNAIVLAERYNWDRLALRAHREYEMLLKIR